MDINTILRTADLKYLHEARQFVAGALHIDVTYVTREVAVGYIQNHYETIGYSGWDGWVEMLQADEESIRRYQERSKA
jgi:hypothetical protein